MGASNRERKKTMIRPMLVAALVSAPFAASAQSGPPKLVLFYSTSTGYSSNQQDERAATPSDRTR